jgi:enamine deaminase RidA (YjgF/YER057c/UK114 family)
MSPFDVINPAALGKPRGYSHGVLAPAGARLLFVAGQTAADTEGKVITTDFVAQFDEALRKTVAVVQAAGGTSNQIARMTVYVADMDTYLSSRSQLTTVWRSHMGNHYPAMALVEVSRLVDRDAAVEIEATAVLV